MFICRLSRGTDDDLPISQFLVADFKNLFKIIDEWIVLMDDGLNSLQYFLQQKFLANCYCFRKIHVLESLGFLQGSVKTIQLGKSCRGSIFRKQSSNSVVNLPVKDDTWCEYMLIYY